jgi:hypothetical protein
VLPLGDHPAKRVPDDVGRLDADLAHELVRIVCEINEGITAGGLIARTDAAVVEGKHAHFGL